MKASHAGLAVISGLAAIVASEALPPEDVPVNCATICGPIVDLTSICTPRNNPKKRKVDDDLGRRAWVPRQVVESDVQASPRQRKQDERRVKDSNDHVDNKRFIVIVPAPTTFPPGLLVDTDPSPTPMPASTPVAPPPAPPAPSPTSVKSPPQPPPPPPPPPSTPAEPTTTRTPTSTRAPTSTRREPTTTAPITSSTTSRPVMPTRSMLQKGSESDGGMSNGYIVAESAEQNCVCMNTSFNVAEIAGLCQSCIAQVDSSNSNMNLIMAACKFPPQQYTPDKDSLASKIQVRATKPTVAWGQGAMVKNAAVPTRTASAGLVVGAVTFVMGAVALM